MTPCTVRRRALTVGMVLLLALALTATMAVAQGDSPPSGGYTYTVQPGDSWFALAWRTNIPVADLRAANPALLHPYDWLRPGERLFIPARPALPPGMQAPGAAGSTAAGDWYQVQPGDTWQIVALKSGVSMFDLWHANPMRLLPNRWLYTGQWLWIPKAAATATLAAPAAPVATATRTLTPTIRAAPTVTPTVALTATSVQPLPAVTVTPTKAVVASAATATATKPAAPPPAATPSSLAGWPAEILALINEQRVSAGVPALVWSPVLARAAQAHADDCAQRGLGSHVGSDGAQLKTRLVRAGYQATWFGENWANYRTVQQTFDAWWDEPPGDDPHRRNILEPNYRDIGIGVAVGGYGYFFIADFGRAN